MPRKPKIQVSERKASESVVAGTLARALGFPAAAAEDVEEVCAAWCDASEETLGLGAVLLAVTGLYPWETDIARGVMDDRRVSPLAEFLASRPDEAFIVKDTERSGVDALWIAIADPRPRVIDAVKGWMVGRGLFRTFRIGDSADKCFILAIQLSSCLKP